MFSSKPTLALALAFHLAAATAGAVAAPAERATVQDVLDRTIAEQAALTPYATHLDTEVAFVGRPADSKSDVVREIFSADVREDAGRFDVVSLRSDHRRGRAQPEPQYRSRNIWDDRRELSRQQYVGGEAEGEIQPSVSSRRRDFRISYPNAPFLYGIARGDRQTIALLLRESGTATLREQTEDVAGHPCLVIEGKNERGEYRLWVDPAAGHQVRRAAVVRKPGDLWFDRKLFAQATGTMQNRSEETIEVTRIEKVGERWVPMAAVSEAKDHYAGGVEHVRYSARRSRFELEPDFAKLGAFVMDGIPEGAVVAVMGDDGAQKSRGVWRDGDVVLDETPAGVARRAAERAGRQPTLEGKPAPETVGVDVDGKPLRLSDYRGKVVALVFWGPWCPPCMAKVPGERALVKALADKPFVLVGVADDEKAETVRATMRKEDMTWPNFYDGQRGPIHQAWGVRKWPTTFVLDGKGTVRFVDPDNLDAAVLALLEEMGNMEAARP